MKIGRLEIKASRFPWQENGRWNNHPMGRFGGGWKFCFGIEAESWRSFVINVGIGYIRFYYKKKQK